jgi:hypothetical protein
MPMFQKSTGLRANKNAAETRVETAAIVALAPKLASSAILNPKTNAAKSPLIRSSAAAPSACN